MDPTVFREAFGVDIAMAQALIESKTITITKLLALAPPGTLDPSPYLYNSGMYAIGSLAAVSVVLHHLIKPVDKKFFERREETQKIFSQR